MKKTKFAISSYISFYEKTYPIIIESMLKAGVPPEDIYFFIGGYDEYEKSDDCVNVWKTNHNSVDFTGLVSVLDLNLKADRWFLLHDTLYVGPNFYNHVKNYDSNEEVIGMSKMWSKNMGSYSQEYLEKLRLILMSEYKNENYDLESIKKTKEMNVMTENRFLTGNRWFTENLPIIVKPATDFYHTGTLRDVQYYFDIDIYKIQSHTGTHRPGNYNLSI